MRMIATAPLELSNTDAAKHSALPHVLLVIDQFTQTLGGGERIALKLAALLPQYGYRASILTFAAHPESPALKSPPCPIYLLPLQRTYDLAALKAAFDLRRFLKQQRIQIVQTFFESSDIWAGSKPVNDLGRSAFRGVRPVRRHRGASSRMHQIRPPEPAAAPRIPRGP